MREFLGCLSHLSIVIFDAEQVYLKLQEQGSYNKPYTRNPKKKNRSKTLPKILNPTPLTPNLP